MLKKKFYLFLLCFLTAFIIFLINGRNFKAQAGENVIFYRNTFDYDSAGLIYPSDFISLTSRGLSPIITNSTYNFTENGFNFLYGYLDVDDSTSTSLYNSVKPWGFLDVNNDYVYQFWGVAPSFQFRLFYNNDYPSNFNKTLSAGVNLYVPFAPVFYPAPLTLELTFYNSNNSQTLTIKRKINTIGFQPMGEGMYRTGIWGTTTIEFLGEDYDNFSNDYEFNYFSGSFYPEHYNNYWLSGSTWLMNFKFYNDYLLVQSLGTIDLPADFIKDIASAQLTFRIEKTDANEGVLDYLNIDDIYFTGQDINLLPPLEATPTPTATPTPSIPPPTPQEPNCEPPTGSFFNDFLGNVRYAICLSFNFLFVPSDEQQQYLVQKLNETKDIIASKPPFGYFSLIKDKFDNFSASATTTEYDVDFNFYDTIDLIKNGLVAILWFIAVLYILKRLKII